MRKVGLNLFTHRHWCSAAMLIVGVCCGPAFAWQNDVWTLTAGDFTTRRVAILAMNDREVRVRDVVNGAQSTIAWDDLLDFTRDAAANRSAQRSATGLVLVLDNGDRLAGEPKSATGEVLTWTTSVGDIQVPLIEARAVVRDGSVDTVGSDPPTEDVVVLGNGDRVAGIISTITRDGLQLSPAGGDAMELKWDAIASVGFAGAGNPVAQPAAAPQRRFRVTFVGESRVSVRSIEIEGDQCQLVVTAGSEPRQVPLKNLMAIEQFNGPIVWLTAMSPAEQVYQPYFAQLDLPAKFDRSVDGAEIRVPPVTVSTSPTTAPAAALLATAERTARSGIGVASYSRLTWAIPPGFARFRTQVAIAGNLPYANVTVRVKLDDERVAFEKSDLTAAIPPLLIDVPLGDAKSLTLEVDYGRSLDVQDRVNWIEPALVKSRR